MKKIFSVVFLCLCAIIFCTNCTSYKAYNPDYRGDIASTTVSVYEAVEKFGEVQVDELEYVIKIELDKDNNIVKETIYDERGNIDMLTKNCYNGKGQLTSSIEYGYDGEERSKLQQTFDGKFVATTSYKSQNQNVNYECRNNGEYIVEYDFYQDDKLVRYVKYDKRGNVFESISYDAEGKEIGKEIQEFDNRDLLVKSIAQDGKITEIIREKRGLPIKLINVYLFSRGLGDSNKFSPGNQTAEIEYEYDEEGNWVKKRIRIMEDDKSDELYIVTRTIEYR
ncbi:hypothetical protein [uncultured Alistipes sp.]|uniref:hypothetical protein n=1 Tax=uncultured Alistipes sp. TaxID=538949 RepID=UPI0025FD7AD7|nr:hypothetical protein [uncultured Alistipes sp.]